MTDIRDAFEAWARHLDISTEQDGWQGLRYTHSHVQAMWEGWQAATLAEQENRQPLTDGDIQTIIEMLERHPTFYHESDCPVAAMSRKLENMRNGIKA